MLAFVATDDHQYTVRNILETREHALQGNVMLLSYRDFLSWPKLPAADYVFVDLERLSTPALRAAGARYRALATAVPGLEASIGPIPPSRV